ALQWEASRLAAAATPPGEGVPEAFVAASDEALGAVHLLSPEGDVVYRGGRLQPSGSVPPVPAQTVPAYRSHSWSAGPVRTRFEPLTGPAGGGLVGWVAVTQAESGVHLEM